MTKWITLILITFIASASLALTPTERAFAEKARAYVREAKIKAQDQQKTLEATSQENAKLDQIAQGQQAQIGTLSGQIEAAHKHEQELAKYVEYAKPIVDQVNKYWGLGAFAYGFKMLARHLLILVAVLAVLALGVFVLSIFFPAIIPIVYAFFAAIGRFFKWLGGLFRK